MHHDPSQYILSHLVQFESTHSMIETPFSLSSYLQQLNEDQWIAHPSLTLHFTCKSKSYTLHLNQSISDVLTQSRMLALIPWDEDEICFNVSFNEQSNYSSHVRIVGTLTPVFSYQVLIQPLNEFEKMDLFPWQLLAITYWEASNHGQHPWVSLWED